MGDCPGQYVTCAYFTQSDLAESLAVVVLGDLMVTFQPRTGDVFTCTPVPISVFYGPGTLIESRETIYLLTTEELLLLSAPSDSNII